MTAQELASAFENSKVGQFCKKAADAVSEFYEEHKTVINAIVGVAVLIACTAATIATGGACGFLYAVASRALIGAVVGAAQGAIGGLITGAVEYYEEYGTLDGPKDKLMESYTEGFAIGAFSGALEGGFGGALEYVKSPGSFCFISGTLILTKSGYEVIENIRIGDKVLSTDPETGETTEKIVLQTFENKTTQITEITIDGETYQATPMHPFYVEGKEFVFATELQVGDKVICYNIETDTTETKEVEEVHNYEVNESVTVYNFEVYENHTYHVGEKGVLVHNRQCDTAKPKKNVGSSIAENSSVKPEAAVSGSKKHGVDWKEGPARAKATGNPQGQWAKSDLDYATKMANTLKPGESAYFDLLEGSQSIVHMPDGTTQMATKMWIRNNGTGTWHGYPMP